MDTFGGFLRLYGSTGKSHLTNLVPERLEPIQILKCSADLAIA
jgi:hypothetical protein